MKNYRTSAILYYAAAVLFYVSAALNFLSDNGNTMDILWFVVGSVYVCLGCVYMKKNKEADADKEDKKDE